MINPFKFFKEISRLKDENESLRAEIRRLKGEQAKPASNIDVDEFRRALDNVSESVCLIDISGTYLYANRKYIEEYGLKAAPLGKKYYDIVKYGTNSKEALDKRINEIRQNGGSIVYHSVYDDNNRVHQISAFLIDSPQGELVWFFMQDITDLINQRDAYSELNSLFEAILFNIPVYLFVKDVENDFRYVYWNSAFAQFSKIPTSRAIGHTDFEIFPDRTDAEKFRKADMELSANPGSSQVYSVLETYVDASGETRLVQTRKLLVPRDGRGPLILGVSSDITDMENIEQELVRERLRAEQSDRMKTNFIASMSHEIRTPLNAIVGFAGILTEDIDPETKKKFADIIKQNSDVLLQLINDALDLAKIEATTLEYVRRPMNLDELLNNVYETYKGRVNLGVALILDAPQMTEPTIINQDTNRIMQVVSNLMTNAIKFTQKGSITFGYKIINGLIEVFVKDTGIGIPKDKLDKVFDRFVKLNDFAQGTGLGLPICKTIVEIFGGKIWVESEFGQGATFKFTIPYLQDKLEQFENVPVPAEEETPAEVHVHGMPYIIVAEDVECNFLLLKAMLGDKYMLKWVRNGEEAVREFKRRNPDLIFMDLKMPKMGGIEAARIIRGYSKDVPIVALTAYAFENDKRMALDTGFNDYLTKPVSKARILSVIAKHLNK